MSTASSSAQPTPTPTPRANAQSTWDIGQLKLSPEVVASMAVNSLRQRISRAILTLLTISTATAFMMYLLTMPRSTDPVDVQSWRLMMVLSLVVSGAGVLNTMLMSVTQRYREIGTMKCLGALDSFILYSVLLEAAILGLIGAIAGAIFGLVISILLAMADHGGNVFAAMELEGIGGKFLFVFFVGMALTTLGALFPAFIASKMPPMEAMRGEK
ncbi:MAG: FtsX-like permease family protein [Verrucomicrobia bacterium]|nr:FtsX-like permease family protein [Verrucomicrobiota bacterium]MCH8510904.1 FtsX-like permease family protein [Kiritimatiellia bacterium]